MSPIGFKGDHMNSRYSRKAFVTLALASLLIGQRAWAVGPPEGAGKPVPNPDIVYMSDKDATEALPQGAVRGIVLSTDGLSGTDVSLRKSKAGRLSDSVTWSPDGTLMAWFEIGRGLAKTPHSLLVGAPGRKPVTIYTWVAGDGQPQLVTGVDTLAWGQDCADPDASMLVLSSHDPAGVYAIRFVDGQPAAPVPLVQFQIPPDVLWVLPSAFAFSPTAQHLAFAGTANSTYGVWLMPMCTADHTPVLLLSRTAIGGTDIHPVRSIDWSRHGDRLAMSVTTAPDPTVPWRDLKIAYLGYLYDGGSEQVTGVLNVATINLDGVFGTESSEHSPQWGPSAAGDACQRIAFSRSTNAGREMYLLDISSTGIGGCALDAPLMLDATWPRALDWK
jgi:hypothetical protein